MISRAAESCFWLHRYVERVESSARMLQVNLGLLLDLDLPAFERWRPVLIVAGEQPRFESLFGAKATDDAETVQDYLTWNEDNPVSILTSLRWGRENARTIRETISLEMWETLNAFWLWLSGKEARRLYRQDRHAFYQRVREHCLLFLGTWESTMPEGEAFDFMRLGLYLERAGQTARILDVKHHTLGPWTGQVETHVDNVQWLAILRSCSASEPFFKGNAQLSGPAVAAFLLLARGFPRSVRCCIDRAGDSLARIREQGPSPVAGERLGVRDDVGKRSATVLAMLRDHFAKRSIADVVASGLHEELTGLIEWVTDACDAVHADFFDPPVDALMASLVAPPQGRASELEG
ncbi:MAG: alpha-E domain-containing protein [Deltaproteobacteria bacterium]|nr:alpha-E domain-containing protein [Deltaproteobacteria bacterium]